MRPFEGALEVNSELKRAQLLFPGNLVGPEAFTMDEEGKGRSEGWRKGIVRIRREGGRGGRRG